MTEISAREALRYATDGELLKLYGILVGGWALTLLSQFVVQTTFGPFASLVGFVLLAVGIATSVIALVAVAYKVLAESRPA